MTILEGLKKVIVERSYSLSDVWHYFLGNYRYKLYYSKDKTGAVRAWGSKHPLMRAHIWEQIKWRIKHMDTDCFNSGSCKLCGCETTALQMCNKSCKKPCYPPMMTRKQWSAFWNGPWTHLDRYGNLWDKGEKGKPFITGTVTLQDIRDYVSKNTSRPGDSQS